MWRDKATDPQMIEIVICVDGNNQAAIDAASRVPDAKVVIQPDQPFNSVRGWNKAAEATTGKVLIAMADDFTPPQGWDKSLLDLSPPGWIDGEYVVHTEDGYVHDICVLSIMTRKRYQKFGYFFYPQYESMFCDTEFTAVAYRDGVVLNAKHLLFEHMHPDCQKRDRDEFDVEHASKDRWARGEMLFNYRKQVGFPVDDGPMATDEHETSIDDKADQFVVYIQATKDDFCLYEVCMRAAEEGVRTFFFCIPDEYWDGKVTPQEDIKQVKDIADKVAANVKNSKVFVQIFDVSQYRFAGDSRIAVETRVRNDTLSWIRREGYSHILIMDGDELWTKGLLDKVKDTVYSSSPVCISAPMIPVVGLPGYPVHNATDRAVVYVGGSVVFRECRSPAVDHFWLTNGIVIHFTACRKTMQEIIDKHRNSGHYDDPDYDFEGWIEKTLPNLKPGWHGAHMYKKYQIWPVVREWSVSEIAQIPESLHPFLGKPVEAPSPIQKVLEPLPKDRNTPRPPPQTQLKVTPFKLNQVEQFVGRSFNPYRSK
jgi:hypothetical protein